MSSLEELVARYVELQEAGKAPPPQAYAARHPDREQELLAALATLSETEAMLGGPDAPDAPDAGRIGDYRVVGELGAGGSGRVLRVLHPAHGEEELALKVLHAGASLHPHAWRRFRREAEALRRLRHPHVVEILDAGEHQGCPFLVMARIDGRPLPQWEPAPGEDRWRAAARLVARLCDAVQSVHDLGLLHRDLKPANVILRPDGEPVLVDFGLVGGGEDETLTHTGDVLGTPAYMAPEQARGERADRRTDVYGLGAILYHLLCRRPPHSGHDAASVLESVRQRLPDPPRRSAPGMPGVLHDLLRRAMAFRPRWRFDSAAAFGAGLAAFAAGQAVPGRYPIRARIDEAWRRHRRPLLATAGIAVAAAATLLLVDQQRVRAAQETRRLEREVARAYLDGGPEPARGAAERLAALQPRHPIANLALGRPAETGLLARSLASGEAAWRAGDHAAALSAFQQAASLAPDSPLAVARLGMAEAAVGDREAAERELAAASRLLPESRAVLHALMEVCRARRRWPQARQAAERLLALEPERAELWHELARICAYGGQPEDGLHAVEKACAKAGGQVPLSYLRTKAAILDELGREAEAIPLQREVARRAPRAQHFLNLGLTLDGAHRLQEARQAYEQALALEPENVQALVCLAYLHAGSDRARCADCRRAFDEHPELLDPGRVERYAQRVLQAERGSFRFAEAVAGYCRQAGRTEALQASIGELLQQEFPAEALGRLLRAQRLLAGR